MRLIKEKKTSPKKRAPKREQRGAPRKELSPVKVSYIASLEDLSKLTREGRVIEASSTGLLIQVERKELMADSLRKNLNLDELIGHNVYLKLDDMNLELSGVVARTKFLGKEGFHIAIDYSDDAPEYWRECLMDLLPKPGEMD